MLSYLIGVLFLGFFVGLVSGMFGLGGGGIIVPALLIFLPMIHVPQTHVIFMAMGTAFATMIISTSASAYTHYKNQNIDFKRIRLFLPILLLTTLLVSQFVTSINPNFLKIAFSIFLIYLGGKMLLQRKKTAVDSQQTSKLKDLLYALSIGTIATLGSISGSGLIITYLNKTGLSLKKAIGTASFCGVFLTTFASLGFIFSGLSQTNLPPYSLGYIHLPTVLILALLSIPTAKIGVQLMLKLPERKVKTLFALFLISLSVYMLFNTLFN